MSDERPAASRRPRRVPFVGWRMEVKMGMLGVGAGRESKRATRHGGMQRPRGYIFYNHNNGLMVCN